MQIMMNAKPYNRTVVLVRSLHNNINCTHAFTLFYFCLCPHINLILTIASLATSDLNRIFRFN